ncbi:hypothetical protein TIFTF001_036593 [Ficus carica]|uniref:Uncharacterized protein n=1 Tax=Ficus carica TaxID=3494 RepID=A0AA88E5K3_FICCA|nr:hypothetical protein TIFTF001_036593 [Ficus carica]
MEGSQRLKIAPSMRSTVISRDRAIEHQRWLNGGARLDLQRCLALDLSPSEIAFVNHHLHRIGDQARRIEIIKPCASLALSLWNLKSFISRIGNPTDNRLSPPDFGSKRGAHTKKL